MDADDALQYSARWHDIGKLTIEIIRPAAIMRVLAVVEKSVWEKYLKHCKCTFLYYMIN
jgi:hypothetical protein